MLSKKFTAIAGAVAEATDDYFKNVTMLLHGDGTNGAQNNTFLDSSTNNFTITRNGNTTQGSYSPYGSLWSNFFNGSSSLYWGGSSDTAYGTGDFTVEGWFNSTGAYQWDGYNNNYGILYSQTVSGTNYFVIGSGGPSSRVVQFTFATSGGGTIISSSTTWDVGVWNHFAVVRTSGVVKIYVNGVAGTGSSCTQDFTNTSNACAIGAYSHTASNFFTGHISNVRVVKGVAVYTGNFTVPTSPLETTQSAGTNIAAITGTSTTILTCKTNSFVDLSSSPQTLTLYGSPSVQRFSPFNQTAAYSTSTIGGSGYFDGTTDSLSFPASSASLLPSTGLFTYEFWVYTPSSALSTCFSYGGNSGNLRCFVSAGGLQLWDGASQYTAGNTALVKYNAWNHVVVQRDATNLTSYVNGTRDYNAANSANFNAGTLYLGSEAGSNPLTGYISDFKFTLGSAPYSGATISVPTAPSSSTGSTAYIGFTNGAIYDNAMMNDLETVGNAQISTSVKKYGTGSMYFDGTGDYIVSPYSTAFDMWRGDSTVECWVYFNSLANSPHLFQIAEPMQSSYRYTVTVYVSGSVVRLYTQVSGSGADRIAGSTTLSTGQWYHVALTKSGSTFTLWLNGVSQGTSTTTVYPYGVSERITLGWQSDGGASGDYLNGYIDDLRITKGVARYTSNFTAPTEALPNK